MEKRQLEELSQPLLKPWRQMHAEDLRPEHRRERIVAGDDPGQVRVHTEEDGDPVQVQDERERDADDGMQSEKRREPDEDAEREGAGGPLWCVVDAKQGIEPSADETSREMDHRKWRKPDGSGSSAGAPAAVRRRTTSRSDVQRPIRVSVTPPCCRAAARRPRCL